MSATGTGLFEAEQKARVDAFRAMEESSDEDVIEVETEEAGRLRREAEWHAKVSVKRAAAAKAKAEQGCCGGGGGGSCGPAEEEEEEEEEEHQPEHDHDASGDSCCASGAPCGSQPSSLYDTSEERAQRAQGKRKTPWTTKVAILVALVAVLFMLRSGEESFSSSEAPDYYKMLQLPVSASHQDIARSYHRLASKYNPKTHPKCKLCPARAYRISNAYRVLSDSVSRAQYDDTRPSVKLIKSKAVEFDAGSFEDLVLNSDDYWVLQVYTDRSSGSAKFATVWEQTVKKLDVDNEKQFRGFVRFGRIHAVDAAELLKFIPVSARVLPLVVSFYKGRFRRMFDNAHLRSLPHFKQVLSEDIPNQVQSVSATAGAIRAFSTHDSNDPRPAVLLLSAKSTPSLLAKGMALRYQHLLRIGLVGVDGLSGSQKEKRAQLKSMFASAGLPVPSHNLPLMLDLSSSKPSWSSVSPATFQEELAHGLLGSVVPVTHGGYHTQCGVTSPLQACVLALTNCAEAVSSSSSPGALLRRTRSLWLEGLERKERKAYRVQFGVVDVQRWPGLAPLCGSSASVVLVLEGGQSMVSLPAPVTREKLVSRMRSLLLHETLDPAATPLEAAPVIDMWGSDGDESFLTRLSEDHSTQMNVIMAVSAVVLLVLLYSCGVSNVMFLIIGLSMLLGGMQLVLPVVFRYLDG